MSNLSAPPYPHPHPPPPMVPGVERYDGLAYVGGSEGGESNGESNGDFVDAGGGCGGDEGSRRRRRGGLPSAIRRRERRAAARAAAAEAEAEAGENGSAGDCKGGGGEICGAPASAVDERVASTLTLSEGCTVAP